MNSPTKPPGEQYLWRVIGILFASTYVAVCGGLCPCTHPTVVCVVEWITSLAFGVMALSTLILSLIGLHHRLR